MIPDMRRLAAALVVVPIVLASCGAARENDSASSSNPVATTAPPTGASAATTSTAPPTVPTTEIPTTEIPTTEIPTTPAPMSEVATTALSTSPPNTTPAPISGAAIASSGCAAPAAPAASVSIDSGGERRTTLLALPDELATPAPLVIDLHGLGADATQQAAYSRLAELGPQAGIVVATPESSTGAFWVLPVTTGTRDVVFVRDLIAQLGSQYCIDTSRVIVTGISNGGGLAAGVGCELADVVTVVVPVSGVNIAPTCDAPSSIVAFHGTDDPIIPYVGGSPFSGTGRSTPSRTSPGGRELSAMSLPAVETVMSTWAAANGCTASSDTAVGADIVHRVWTGCRPGATVELYTVIGGGHTWPGATPVPPLGETTTAVDATQIVFELARTLTRS
jgi:polyhydroxybutyrate depolymerase